MNITSGIGIDFSKPEKKPETTTDLSLQVKDFSDRLLQKIREFSQLPDKTGKQENSLKPTSDTISNINENLHESLENIKAATDEFIRLVGRIA